jgi:hypothetical protein
MLGFSLDVIRCFAILAHMRNGFLSVSIRIELAVLVILTIVVGCCSFHRPGPFLTGSPNTSEDEKSDMVRGGAYVWWEHCDVCNQCGGPDQSDDAIKKVDLHNHYKHSNKAVAYRDGTACLE